jgi:outer membrane protein assembly factor BamB
MFTTFAIMVVVALIGTALAIVFIYPAQTGAMRQRGRSRSAMGILRTGAQNWTVLGRVTCPRLNEAGWVRGIRVRYLTRIGLFALLIMLVGCSNPMSPQATQPAGSTPLSLPPQTSTQTVTPPNSADWTTYHHDNTRAGYAANMPDPRQFTRTWGTRLDGAVYAEPLVVGGRLLVVTEGDSLYSLDARTGQVQWHTNVGTPVPLATLPCGNIDPLGITGTPVYDPATGLVFAVAEVSGPAHILVGVDVNTGKVRVRRSVDTADMDITPHQQRAALALSQGMVYIAYGGLDGDCGNYHGWVVASRTDGRGSLLSYEVPTPREGGIWAPSGPAVDGAGNIYVAVGNGATTSGNWDHSDSVLRLSPELRLEDGFAPTSWPQENAEDADLGSMGPLLLPGGLVFADGKSGLGYLLHANALGGIGGQFQVAPICHAFGGSAALGSRVIVPCADGLRAIQVGSGGTLTLSWHAPGGITGSPVVGGHTVYTVNPGGTLYALNIESGAVIATLSVGQASRFASPTLSGNQVFVGTLTGVVAVAVS